MCVHIKLHDDVCGVSHVSTCPRVPVQVLTAVSVSTGCLSYGLCMAYTSSATPSIMEQVDENILSEKYFSLREPVKKSVENAF